jgi:hypothetical protein
VSEFTAQDLRSMEAYCAWRILTEGATKSTRLNARVVKVIRRGITLERMGVQLVAADDPAGAYDSPRLMDINCAVSGREEWIALRRSTSANGLLSDVEGEKQER